MHAKTVKRSIPESRVGTRITSGQRLVVRADESRQREPADSFSAEAFRELLLQPHYSIPKLRRIYLESSMLKPCVDAMVTNVVMFGFEVAQVSEDVPIDVREAEVLKSFSEWPNSEESLMMAVAKMYDDYESQGRGYLEAIRDARDRLTVVRHCQALNIRLTTKHPDVISISYDVARGKRVRRVTERKRFRRFVQIIDGVTTYFKEWGDPRRLNYKSGEFETDLKLVPDDQMATELIHFSQYSDDPYGTPKWVSQLPSILGSRKAEEGNLDYFDNNTIPPLMLMVSGGRLTKQSYTELTKLLSGVGLGKDRQHSVLIIEAIPDRETFDDKGTVSIGLEKLTDARQGDALFSEYDKSNKDKIRTAFRLPSAAVGLAQEHNFATMTVSAYLAETQVYAPARAYLNERLNKTVVNHPNGLGISTCSLLLKASSITNPEQLVKTLTAMNVMGAMTPRKAIKVINTMLQIKIDQYPEQGGEGYEEWMDKPIQLSIRTVAGSDPNALPDHTQIEQGAKPNDVKALEGSGDIGLAMPQHGQE